MLTELCLLECNLALRGADVQFPEHMNIWFSCFYFRHGKTDDPDIKFLSRERCDRLVLCADIAKAGTKKKIET